MNVLTPQQFGLRQNLNENQNFIVERKKICEIKLSWEVDYHASEPLWTDMIFKFFKIFQALQPCLFLGSCNYKQPIWCNVTLPVAIWCF